MGRVLASTVPYSSTLSSQIRYLQNSIYGIQFGPSWSLDAHGTLWGVPKIDLAHPGPLRPFLGAPTPGIRLLHN